MFASKKENRQSKICSTSFVFQMTMNAIKSVIFLYDIITLPIYAIFQRPWINRREQKRKQAKLVDENDLTSYYVRTGEPTKFDIEFSTINEIFSVSCKKYGSKRCMGVRKCIREEEFVGKNNKTYVKKILEPEYTWYTFSQIDERINNVMKGFLLNGIKPHDVVVMLLETRLEWLICVHALFRIGCVIATLYDTLGEEGITHGIKELEANHLITLQSHVPMLVKYQSKLTKLKCVITLKSTTKLTKNTKLEKDVDTFFKVLSLDQVEEEGTKADTESEFKTVPPKSSDLALIMFTSGSTGNPKGIQITHHNFVSTLKTIHLIVDEYELKDDTCYVGYLPLAHIFEFTLEHVVLSKGFSIGFSSTLTLSDHSPCIKAKTKGDVTVLKPSIIASVPLILDRIRKDVIHEVEKRGQLVANLFEYFVNYKSYWLERGWRTPLLDFFVFNKLRSKIGENVKLLIIGGSSVSIETQKFCKICFNTNVVIGYGLTEVSGAITATGRYDNTYGFVGAPLHYIQVKLVEWKEGGYSPFDKPNPRGEIVVHSETVAMGYFKNEEENKKVFVECDGKRWLYTGDIGEMYPNGVLKIIDRKKDLIKLLTGEYVSLGKIESALKENMYVQNVCIHANDKFSYVIALIVPNRPMFEKLFTSLNLSKTESFADHLSDPKVVKYILNDIQEHSRKAGLTKYEIPQRIILCKELWTTANGMVTMILKIRRKPIYDFYKEDIQRLYHSDNWMEANGTSKQVVEDNNAKRKEDADK